MDEMIGPAISLGQLAQRRVFRQVLIDVVDVSVETLEIDVSLFGFFGIPILQGQGSKPQRLRSSSLFSEPDQQLQWPKFRLAWSFSGRS